MLVRSDQLQHRRTKRTSARKHEGVRTPTARNAIVRDRESGAYQANVDAALSEVDSLRLRVNALELEVSRLRQGEAVAKGYAAPLMAVGETPRDSRARRRADESNVVPMSVARAAKAEKDSAVQASHPLPVEGNEALALPSPSTEPTAKANPAEVRHPSQVVLVPSQEAANDSDGGHKEVADALADITDVSVADVATLAKGFGLTLEELSQIAYKEYAKRELNCYERHGKSRDDVQLMRLSRQHSPVEPGGYVSAKTCGSGYRAWNQEIEARLPHLRAEAAARMVREYRSPAHHGKLVKGEAKYRRKQFLKDRAAAKPANRAAFGRVQEVSRKLYVDGPGVTTDSQVKALRTLAWAGYQKARKLLGMQPTVRGAVLRTRYEVADSIEASQRQADLEKTLGIVPRSEAETLPMRELVRRYQRAGIG